MQLRVVGQWVTIPDTAFAALLNAQYPQCMNGNQMDTSCSLIVTTATVLCFSKGIKDLTGIQYFDELKALSCWGNNLTTLPPLPSKIKDLDVSSNKLQSLPFLPATLIDIDASHNQLKAVPNLPPKLESLALEGNDSLTILPSLPLSLKEMTVAKCSLSSLPALPDSIAYLYVDNNRLAVLPTLPSSLKELDCSYNMLSALPTLPITLETIDCSNNNLTILPTLPDTLLVLRCSNNYLTSLPALTSRLDGLACANNHFSTFGPLPTGLISLNCGGGSLTDLPALPSKLQYLTCNYSSITQIGAFPDSLVDCILVNNALLTCLPRLNKIYRFIYTGTPIACLPNYVSVALSLPSLSNVPLCKAGNLASCSAPWNLGGQAFHDSNANCQQEAGDTEVSKVKFSLHKNGSLLQQVQSDVDGFYAFETTDTGKYQIVADTSGLPFTVNCPADGMYTLAVDSVGAIDSTRFFSLTCKPGFDLTAHSIASAGVFRPALNTFVHLSAGDYSNFFNGRCASGIGGTVTLTIIGPAVYSSSPNGALTPTAAGNVLTWNVADFGTTNLFTSFDVIVQTDTFAQQGNQICFTLTVSTTATGDNNPANNTLTHCFNVVNSYDPNDKAAYPAGNIDTTVDWLTYTVRFQNTGTAEAIHINITDTLDSDLDPTSFQLLAYSHQPEVQLVGNAIKFNFPYINLPDSNTNEPESHGYVQYKVKLKDNRPIGTQIDNTAFIYFDFNPPVITNTTTNTVAVISSLANVTEEGIAFNLYPNPANQSVTIHTAQTSGTITIADVTGREAIVANIQSAYTQLNIQQLPKGVYLVTVTDANGAKATKRLVKN